LYEHFVAQMRQRGLRCETGQFQAMMSVALVNEGPVTILLDLSLIHIWSRPGIGVRRAAVAQ